MRKKNSERIYGFLLYREVQDEYELIKYRFATKALKQLTSFHKIHRFPFCCILYIICVYFSSVFCSISSTLHNCRKAYIIVM